MRQLSPRARRTAMVDAADLRPPWFDNPPYADEQEFEARLHADLSRAPARQRAAASGSPSASQGAAPAMSGSPAAEDTVEDEASDDDSGNDSDTSTGGGILMGSCRMSPMGRLYSNDQAGIDAVDGTHYRPGDEAAAVAGEGTALEDMHVAMMVELLLAMYANFDNGIPTRPFERLLPRMATPDNQDTMLELLGHGFPPWGGFLNHHRESHLDEAAPLPSDPYQRYPDMKIAPSITLMECLMSPSQKTSICIDF